MTVSRSKKNKNHSPELFTSEFDPIKGIDTTSESVMYCDGASSGNPGQSGIGVVIYFSDEDAQRFGGRKNYKVSENIGIATNNIAEYSALIKGLKVAKSLGIRKIKVFLDSELIVRQMKGVYKVKNKKLFPLWNQANEILHNFECCTIVHVCRERNKEADSLAKRAI